MFIYKSSCFEWKIHGVIGTTHASMATKVGPILGVLYDPMLWFITIHSFIYFYELEKTKIQDPSYEKFKNSKF